MLLARNADVSQRAASVRDALEQIGARREAEGKKRAAPAAKLRKSAAAASPDLTELLRNVGPDEVRDALRAAGWELAALRELRHYLDEILDKSLQHAPQLEAHTLLEETILLPDAVKSTVLEIAIYAVERDGRVDPNDYHWRLLVLRAKAMFAFEASAAGRLPLAREH